MLGELEVGRTLVEDEDGRWEGRVKGGGGNGAQTCFGIKALKGLEVGYTDGYKPCSPSPPRLHPPLLLDQVADHARHTNITTQPPLASPVPLVGSGG